MLAVAPEAELTVQTHIERLLAFAEFEAQKIYLTQHSMAFDEAAAKLLKQQADRVMRSNIHTAQQISDLLLYLSDLKGCPVSRALGVAVKANTLSVGGLGDYAGAVDLYNEAASIYQQQGRIVEQAKTLTGKIYSLAFLGRYTEAVSIGEWVKQALEERGEWQLVAGLRWNLAIVYGRQGEDAKALDQFNQVYSFYQNLGEQGTWFLPMVEQNRAILLRNLGQFDASIQASQNAWTMLEQLGQTAEMGRAQQNLAFTYFVLGRYNKALELLDRASAIFLADGRQSDALVVELYITDCLLQLRRFTDVIEKAQRIRELFIKSGSRLEISLALLNEAIAYAGLGRFAPALISLAEAQKLFEQEGNQVWMASAHLEKAAILLRQGSFVESLATSQTSLITFRAHELPIKEAQACLTAARAALALHQDALTHSLIMQALEIGESKDLPTLTYQGHHLLGNLFKQGSDNENAFAEYKRAILALERLRGSMMVEFRAEFLEDKQGVYEDMVDLCLTLHYPEEGLVYAERAKSRALLDLLAFRVDLGIHAKDAVDVPLVDELTHLRKERDRLYRRWESREEFGVRGEAMSSNMQADEQQKIINIEKQITNLWHKLLVRNADYARDADLWQIHSESIQEYIPIDTLLIEYFTIRDQLIVFLITPERVQAIRLSARVTQVRQLLRLVQLNMKSVHRSTAEQIANLNRNIIGLLQQLYQLLITPIRDHLVPYQRLMIVPHGALHYLPFHALHNGQAYLLEQQEISYLPGANLLRYCLNTPSTSTQLVALGHSYQNKLPYTVQEAQSIAQMCGGRAILEEEATTAQLREIAGDCRILHLATHGDFRADNPLFSGLALADGWLTTLDIFNLRLQTSLVTLSACQTGRNVVGGGDELLGLMRAFLYAGASSLVASLWAVEDRSTAQIMTTFYQRLFAGQTKSAALRSAQLDWLHSAKSENSNTPAHPYFWAPFFLVGHAGAL